MDFELNDEQRMMIETVRRFISEELKPLEDEVEEKRLSREHPCKRYL
jgi:acyl-CoA dehydrogenase